MADLQFIGAVEKLNNQNYSMWQTCMESYFQGLDLWEIVGGSDITPPPAANAEALRKWRIKAGKVMFAIKTTVEKEMLEYIRYASTPKEAWDILPARIREKENEMRRLQLLESEHMSRDTTKYVSLHRALVKGDLESVKAFLAQDENAISVPISMRGERPIHIAVAEGHVQLVEELVKMINPSFLEFRQDDGETALHIAARGADTRIAKALVEAYGELVRLENRNHHLPVTLAAIFGNTEMFNYLRSVTSQQDLIPRIVNIPRSYFDQQNYRIYAMFADSIKGENYGFALDMLEINPELACGGSGRGTWALYTVAEMPIAFSSRNLFGNLKIWMYNFMDVPPANVYNKRDEENLPQTSRSQYPSTFKRFKDEVFLMVLRCLKGLMSNVLKIDVEQEILNMKNKHIQARELLKKMCNPNSTSDPKQTEAYFEATKRAIKCGNGEFVEEVLRSNPTLLWGNKESGSIFHMAIACRQERIWNLFYGLSIANRNKITEILVESHSMLHIAACPVVLSKVIGRPDGNSEKQGEQQFWKVFSHAPGAAMEVQREVQWYKEVERIVPSSQKFLTNENGETPPALFWKWHCELVKEGEKWMRDTATSCTIVATLIVTVMFAAAFTLPGGTDDNSGNPKFLQRNSFMVFVLSDALSLFSSVTSVLMFLSILTSHYAEKDFLKSLPKRLIIGLATLFLSIAAMMVAFGTTLVIVLGEQISWAAAPVSLLAGIPVTLFALLQFPLLVDMVSSTYGRGIFNRKTKGLFV